MIRNQQTRFRHRACVQFRSHKYGKISRTKIWPSQDQVVKSGVHLLQVRHGKLAFQKMAALKFKLTQGGSFFAFRNVCSLSFFYKENNEQLQSFIHEQKSTELCFSERFGLICFLYNEIKTVLFFEYFFFELEFGIERKQCRCRLF